jgi:hypothetical protein
LTLRAIITKVFSLSLKLIKKVRKVSPWQPFSAQSNAAHNCKSSLKGLANQDKNSRALLSGESMTKKKNFITSTPGAKIR